MATVCGKLTAGFARDCTNNPVGGVRSMLYIFNQSDIASVVYDTTNPLIVTGITLVTGAQAFAWEVYKRQHKPKATQKDTEYSVNYQHELVSYIPTWDSATKNQVEQLGKGYYVVIVENLQNTGDSRFEVYGLAAGLRSQDGAVRDLGANEGVMTLTLANDADMFEPHLPSSFIKTSGTPAAFDYTMTKAAVQALLIPAT